LEPSPAGAELAQGGRGINGLLTLLETFFYAELLASLLQAEAELCGEIMRLKDFFTAFTLKVGI
jgi:hypothetical protein